MAHAVVSGAPAPVASEPPPDGLHVVVWDLHAARALAARIQATGRTSPGDVVVRGRRCADGLQEAQVRPRHHLTTRWRLNLVVAWTAAVVVGAPMGASAATLLLGERPVVAWVGAVIGGVGLALAGWYAVWADFRQRLPGSRNQTRVEGHILVRGRAVEVAEMLLATTEEVRLVEHVGHASDTWGLAHH